MTIQDDAGKFYIVTEAKSETCYWAVPARRLKGAFVAMKRPERLISKAGTRVVEA